MRVVGDFSIHEHHSEQNEITELRMNHVAMNPHASETRSDSHRLVRNDPHLRSPAVRFHGETHRSAIHRADTDSLELRDNLAGSLVGFVACVMKFEISDGACRGTNLIACHANPNA